MPRLYSHTLLGIATSVLSLAAQAQPALRDLAPVFPVDKARDVDIAKPFQMPVVPLGEFCDVRVSESPAFSGLIKVRQLAAGMSQLDMKADLAPDKTYYWQVQCRTVDGAQPLTARSATLSFKTIAMPLPKFDLLSPLNGAQDVPIYADVRFTWDRYLGATTYKLTIAKKMPEKTDKPIVREITYSTQVNPTDPANPPYEFVELKNGIDYVWHVEALVDKNVVARSDDQTFRTRSAFFEEAAKIGFKLQRAFTFGDSSTRGDPATFGFAAQSGATPSFNTEFALQWLGPDMCSETGTGHIQCPDSVRLIRPEASIEARLNSSGNTKKNDALKARIAGVVNVKHSPGVSSFFMGSFKYETDKKADTKKELVELLYTPSVACKIGMMLPCDKDDYTGRTKPRIEYTYMWRPYFGVDAGRTSKVGDSLENESTVVRAIVRLTGRVNLHQLAGILSLPNVSVFIDDYNRYLFRTTDHHNNNYLQTGMDFFVNDAFSIALRGNIGRDAPNFQFVRNFSINFGARF
jgi:hypothetical protein